MKDKLMLVAFLITLFSLGMWFGVLGYANEQVQPTQDTTQTETGEVEPSQASQAPYEWHDKLKRGAINVVTSPVEIARNIQLTTQEESLLAGWTVGLGKGVGEGVLRLGAGTVDLLTSPFSFPEARKAPLMQPEYVWQKPGVKYV